MACNVFSGIICYVIIFLCYAKLKFIFSNIFRTGKTSLTLRFKDTKALVDCFPLAAALVGDECPTSSCPATTTLPCRDSTTFLRQFSLLYL